MCQALNTLNIDRTGFLPSGLEFSGRNNFKVREKGIGVIMVSVQATVGRQETYTLTRCLALSMTYTLPVTME